MTITTPPRPYPGFLPGLGAVWAFVRRDFLIAWSYPVNFLSGFAGMIGQVAVFYFVAQIVDPSRIGGQGPTAYVAFVSVGVAVTTFFQLGAFRLATALRTEQFIGTIESLLVAPVSMVTLQFGLVAYELMLLPVRMALFLGMVGLLGVTLHPAGVLSALLLLVAFAPFVAGVAALSAAATLRFKNAWSVIGAGTAALAVLSGAYFPVSVFPQWLFHLAAVNPMAIVLDGMRAALLSGSG
ncbi:MAG: ABC transporter permease, partial [Armatimonadota bacterium]|nr:ABC transporter permease [Armatimonadota bacterium]